jgi:hypothetical protein
MVRPKWVRIARRGLHGADELAGVRHGEVDLVARVAVDDVEDQEVRAERRLDLRQVPRAGDEPDRPLAADEAEPVRLDGCFS